MLASLFGPRTPAQRARILRERLESLKFAHRQLQAQPFKDHKQWERRTTKMAVVSREMGDLLRDIQELEEASRSPRT